MQIIQASILRNHTQRKSEECSEAYTTSKVHECQAVIDHQGRRISLS